MINEQSSKAPIKQTNTTQNIKKENNIQIISSIQINPKKFIDCINFKLIKNKSASKIKNANYGLEKESLKK